MYTKEYFHKKTSEQNRQHLSDVLMDINDLEAELQRLKNILRDVYNERDIVKDVIVEQETKDGGSFRGF